MEAPGQRDEFAKSMGAVARAILGEPDQIIRAKKEMRYGTRGSLCIALDKGTWFDNEAGEGGGVLAFVMREKSLDKPDALKWLEQNGHIKPVEGKSREVAAYNYVSASDVLLFQVVRFEPKTFRQRSPDGRGGFEWSIKGVQRVLYRLPRVLVAIKAGETIYIAEGEKGVLALESIGVTGTCCPGGAGKWGDQYDAIFRDASVVVLPDNDPQTLDEYGQPKFRSDGRPIFPGQDHAADVAVHLTGIAASVRVLMLPNLPVKGDVADWVAAGGTADQLRALVDFVDQSTESLAAPGINGHSKEPNGHTVITPEEWEAIEKTAGFIIPGERPSIAVVAGRVDLVATSAEAALIHSKIEIYQRGIELVRPSQQMVPASKGRMTISAGMSAVGMAGMIDLLSQAADWLKYDGRSKKQIVVDPPALVAGVILARKGKWTMATIAGVITTPTIRPDGTILHQPGYDGATRLYQVVDPSLIPAYIPHHPTKEQAQACALDLDALLDEFPFVAPVDRSVAMSALITPVVRGAVTVAPMHAIRASTAGTGKSYLADTASAIATGRPCPVMANSAKPEETESRLVGMLLSAFPIISIDNVNGELGGDLLAQAIERPTVRVRRLGNSDIFEIESRATFFATGNGLRVKGDMSRRTVICDLDAGLERPEMRQFVRSPVDDVLADRGRYVAAALTIVRAYIVAGKPNPCVRLASFEEWSDLVRSALVWLGYPDPVLTTETAREDDPDLISIREIITSWESVIGANQPKTVKQITEIANQKNFSEFGDPTEYRSPEFREAILAVASSRGEIENKRFGDWLRGKEGRIINGLRIKKAGKDPHTKNVLWQIELR